MIYFLIKLFQFIIFRAIIKNFRKKKETFAVSVL
nr:MAG TPA: hypothetical protein [Caudoviricetes sp.]